MRKPPQIVEPRWVRLKEIDLVIDLAIARVEQYFPVGLDKTLTIQLLEKASQLHKENEKVKLVN